MTWVKLCGLQSVADVEAAQAAGADAVGFVTAPGSVRQISVERAAEIGRGCSVATDLVTEDETPDSLLAAARLAGVTGVQPHGAHSLEACRAALDEGYDVLFPAAAAGRGVSWALMPEGAILILDAAVPGGGVRFEDPLPPDLPDRFVVAGGLTPENVGSVLSELNPYGVDVSSGIERERGVKDAELMVRFVEAAR